MKIRRNAAILISDKYPNGFRSVRTHFSIFPFACSIIHIFIFGDGAGDEMTVERFILCCLLMYTARRICLVNWNDYLFFVLSMRRRLYLCRTQTVLYAQNVFRATPLRGQSASVDKLRQHEKTQRIKTVREKCLEAMNDYFIWSLVFTFFYFHFCSRAPCCIVCVFAAVADIFHVFPMR